MKKFLTFFITILLLIILAIFGFLFLKNSNSPEISIIPKKDKTYNIDNEFNVTIKEDYQLEEQSFEKGYRILLYSEKDKFEFYISEIANILNYPLIRIAEADKEVYHKNWEISSNFSEINSFNIGDINGYGYTFNVSNEKAEEYFIISDFIQIGDRVYAIDAEFPIENKEVLLEEFNDILNTIKPIEK